MGSRSKSLLGKDLERPGGARDAQEIALTLILLETKCNFL